jgi:hypothetical protein
VRFSTLDAFEKWFDEEYDKVDLEQGARELGPLVRPTVEPGEPPWKLEWCIVFQDGKYIRVAETYEIESRYRGGGAYRTDFSFHYGNFPAGQNRGGWPVWRAENQFDIRIDHDPARKFHIHFNGENHIPQSRVKGMDISLQSVIAFVMSIHEHRRTGKPLDEVFGFTVEAV